MSPQQTIEIIIDSKGDSVLQTKGFVGSTCREGSRFLEQALGAVVSDAATTEMYQSAVQQERLHQHGS